MISAYKNQLITASNWVLIGLILLLWIRFALQDDEIYSDITSPGIKPMSNYSAQQRTKSIADYHIFGSAQELIDIPLSSGETNLNFVLNGTMSNSDEQAGLAYISNGKGIQEKFLVGDKIFDSATLKEIHKTYIVLQHNGKNERLSLRENSQVSQMPRKSKINNKPPAYLKHLNGGQQANWQETMNQQKFNPTTISNIVKKVNFVADQKGNIQGIRVSSLSQGDLLTQSGLQSNDIITAINGNNITATNMLSIKQKLEKNPNATVTIKRNGKIQNIQVDLRKL